MRRRRYFRRCIRYNVSPEVATDFISGVDKDYVGVDVREKFGDYIGQTVLE